jgi:diphosphomevalonate decarboxylase
MKKCDVIRAILGERINNKPQDTISGSFAPTNIALCKYWGKSNSELNLPMTPSLSISLLGKGSMTAINVIDEIEDQIVLNGEAISVDTKFSRRLLEYINLFREQQSVRFHIDIASNIPLAAGLASSASGFASLILALNGLYHWGLSQKELSILARLGSGSACRSLWNGFVEWQVGSAADGMDSHGCLLSDEWQELCIGLLIVNTNEKAISSREAMERTKMSSTLYSLWPDKVNQDMSLIKQAIKERDFSLLGKTAESNAMTMHAMMLSAWPPISYWQPETIDAMQKIWQLRQEGLPLYFTQDAGPNLKLLFLRKDIDTVRLSFSNLEVLQPFKSSRSS